MKKIISMVLVLAVLCMSTLGVYAQGTVNTTKIHYNGKYVTLGTKPTTTAGKTFVPLKELGTKIGIPVTYNAKTKCYTAKKGTIIAVVNTTKKNMALTKDGKTTTVNLGADMKLLKTDIMLPVKVVADSFNIGLGFDAKSNTVIMLDLSYFENLLKTKAPAFYQYVTAKYTKVKSAELKGKYSGSLYMEGNGEADATNLDIKGNMDLNAKYNNNTYSIQGSAKLSGVEELMDTDALNNIDFQIIIDNDAIYIKTNLFELLEIELGDKWGRIFIEDLGIEGVNSLEDLQKYEDDQKGYNLNEILSKTDETMTVDTFKTLNDIFTLFLSLVDADNFKVVKTNSTTLIYTWNLTKNDIVKLSFDALIKNAGKSGNDTGVSLDDLKELKALLSKSEFNFNAKMTVVNNVLTSSECNMNLQLKHEDFGLIKASFKSTMGLTNINNNNIKVAVPTEAQVVDLSELTE